MFVFYNPTTLAIDHVVHMAPPNYAAFLATRPDLTWVQTDLKLSPKEIEILPNKTVGKRVAMTLTPTLAKAGLESTVAGIPPGAAITFNGAVQGVMDASGLLEFTPATAGVYKITITCTGFIKEELSLEILA
jgi:hypothetical protein